MDQLRLICPSDTAWLKCSLYWTSWGRDRLFPQEFLTQGKGGLVTPNMGHRFRDIQKPSGNKFKGGELFNVYFGGLTPDIFRGLFPGYYMAQIDAETVQTSSSKDFLELAA